MICVEIFFDAGRFHATPWGKHVNEATPEWPPSTWRLFRALVSVWKKRHRDLGGEAVESALFELRGAPLYDLPEATVTHTRHFMPTGLDRKKSRETRKVLDVSVQVDSNDPVRIVWPNPELTEKQREVLSKLLSGLPYFGRAESWCSAGLSDAWELNRDAEELIHKETEETRKLVTPVESGQSRQMNPRKVLVPKENVNSKQPFAREDTASYCVATDYLREEKGIIDPPAGRWVSYDLPSDALTARPSEGEPEATKRPAKTIRAVLFEFGGQVLPPVTRTVRVAELARRACLGLHSGGSRVFSGKDSDGEPLNGHEHAFYLPLDSDRSGRIDQLAIVARGGFSSADLEALDQLDRLKGNRGRIDLRCTEIARSPSLAELEDFSYFARGREWVSVTPYLLNRYPKTRGGGEPREKPMPDRPTFRKPDEGKLRSNYGINYSEGKLQKDGPADQLLLNIERRRRQWGEEAIPKLEKLSPKPAAELQGGKTERWLNFKRRRISGPEPTIGNPYGFRLKFAKPLQGPLALGYSSHFGLGLFGPNRD